MGSIPCNIRKTADEIFCTCRIKTYPDGSREYLACEKPIFGGSGWEEADDWSLPLAQPNDRDQEEKGPPTPENIKRAMRRARAQLKDYALCTQFKYFVTLTLDAAKVDRYDMPTVTKKLNNWLDNHVRRDGLVYVLVPERHKDGAVHFHGFFNDALQAVDSGTMTADGWKHPRRPRSKAQRREWAAMGAKPVYNLPAWSLGFTTAIELYGEYRRAVAYVCKYIGKAEEKIGGRWYYSGGCLGQPTVEYCDLPLRDIAAKQGAFCFTIDDAHMAFAMWVEERRDDHGSAE